MGKTKCSERFLRSCLWAVNCLSEEEQTEICLRRACQRLRVETCEGCFTDPAVTERYIERCFGKDVWDAVHKEIKEASEICDSGMLLERFAFDVTLPQDIIYLNKVFGEDVEGKKFTKSEVKPAMYKHGNRSASGLRNTYACRSARNWVMAEYSAYCKDCVRGGVNVDAPYTWLSKEIERMKGGMEVLPLYTEFNDGNPIPVSTPPSDYGTISAEHLRYMGGIYDVLCNLVTLRLLPKFELYMNPTWHNVWYYGTQANYVPQQYLKQFITLSLMEVVYLEIARELVPIRKEREYRLTYNPADKADAKMLATPEINQCLMNGLKNKDFRFGCEMLGVIVRNPALLNEIFGSKTMEERKDIFRKTLRPYCYADFNVADLPGYRVCSKHRADVSEYALRFPDLEKVLGVAVVTSNVALEGISEVSTRDFLYMNDCLEGDGLTNAIKRVQPAKKIRVIYVGTGNGPRVLVGSETDENILKANVEVFDYETLDFVPIKDEAFYTSEAIITGSARNAYADTEILGACLTQEEKDKFQKYDVLISWMLIYDAINSFGKDEGDADFMLDQNVRLIRLDSIESFLDYRQIRRKNEDETPDEYAKRILSKCNWHITPYPMISAPADIKVTTPVGGTMPLTTTRLRPIYVITKNLDSYYGLTSSGGVEIIADMMTDKALILKRELFLSALGLSDACIKELCSSSYLDGNVSYALGDLRRKDMYKEALRLVKEALAIHNLQIAPVSLYNLRSHSMQEIIEVADKTTWDLDGIWDIKRLVFRGGKEDTPAESTEEESVEETAPVKPVEQRPTSE